jgi:hypothetical protein
MARVKRRPQIRETVRTVVSLSKRLSFISKANQDVRRPNSPGVIIEHQKDGDYLVLHEGETIPAVYKSHELIPEPNAYWVVTYPACWQHEETKTDSLCYKEFATYGEVEDYILSLSKLPIVHLDGSNGVTVEGPFYSHKELSEGFIKPRTIFEHLMDKDTL